MALRYYADSTWLHDAHSLDQARATCLELLRYDFIPGTVLTISAAEPHAEWKTRGTVRIWNGIPVWCDTKAHVYRILPSGRLGEPMGYSGTKRGFYRCRTS